MRNTRLSLEIIDYTENPLSVSSETLSTLFIENNVQMENLLSTYVNPDLNEYRIPGRIVQTLSGDLSDQISADPYSLNFYDNIHEGDIWIDLEDNVKIHTENFKKKRLAIDILMSLEYLRKLADPDYDFKGKVFIELSSLNHYNQILSTLNETIDGDATLTEKYQELRGMFSDFIDLKKVIDRYEIAAAEPVGTSPYLNPHNTDEEMFSKRYIRYNPALNKIESLSSEKWEIFDYDKMPRFRYVIPDNEVYDELMMIEFDPEKNDSQNCYYIIDMIRNFNDLNMPLTMENRKTRLSDILDNIENNGNYSLEFVDVGDYLRNRHLVASSILLKDNYVYTGIICEKFGSILSSQGNYSVISANAHTENFTLSDMTNSIDIITGYDNCPDLFEQIYDGVKDLSALSVGFWNAEYSGGEFICGVYCYDPEESELSALPEHIQNTIWERSIVNITPEQLGFPESFTMESGKRYVRSGKYLVIDSDYSEEVTKEVKHLLKFFSFEEMSIHSNKLFNSFIDAYAKDNLKDAIDNFGDYGYLNVIAIYNIA